VQACRRRQAAGISPGRQAGRLGKLPSAGADVRAGARAGDPGVACARFYVLPQVYL